MNGVTSKAGEYNVTTATINKTAATGSKMVKTAKPHRARLVARQLRNFTYELHDVENVFTSKISFFLKELNKQLNALVNSNIYTENKEKLDKVIKSKGEFRKELLRLLKTEQSYKDFYQKYYFEAKIFGNKAKYFRTVIEEYRRILLSRLSRQTVIDMIVNNPTITYQEVFNKLCELNERRSSENSDYKFNWISKAEFNNIIKQLSNLDNLSKSPDLTSEAKAEVSKQGKAKNTTIDNLSSIIEAKTTSIDVYAIDYSSEDDQISEFNLTESEDKEYYLVEFKLKYSDYTTQSDSLLIYQCKIPKKQIKGLTTGYTKLEKFTRPRIFLRNLQGETSEMPPSHKLYISYNYELEPASQQSRGQHSSSSEQTSEASTDDTWQFKTMGIDIGVAKSATAAIMTTNMCWAAANSEPTSEVMAEQVKPASESGEDTAKGKQHSNSEAGEVTNEKNKPAEPELVASIDFTKPVAISSELTISDKTKAVSEHIEILRNEQNHIYKKEQAIASLLKLSVADGSEAASKANASFADEHDLVNHNNEKQCSKSKNSTTSYAASATLLHKYHRLNKLRLHLRSKVSNLKKELSFLTARDMISHAIDNNVDLIALEKLSWISDADKHHTTWDYSQIQQRIIHEANIYGIKVKKVSCANSSAHNPLTLEKEEVDQNRKLVKCLFDRDYAAAIILARRGVKLGRKKLCSFAASPSQKQNCKEQIPASASHINDSFQAVSLSIKPSLQYRQLKLCEQKSIMHESNFAYYSVL